MADEQELQHLRVVLDYLPCEDCEHRVPGEERRYMCSVCGRINRNVSAEIAVPRWRTENGSVVAVEGRDIEELRPEVSMKTEMEEEPEEPAEDMTEEIEVLEIGVDVPEEEEEPDEEELPEWETVEETPHTVGEYTLHTKEATLRGGRKQQIFFYAKKEKKDATPCAKPEGYEVKVNENTGLPVLKKKKK
jgi:hypothetical protein